MRWLESIVERLFLGGSSRASLLKISVLVGCVPVLIALPLMGRAAREETNRQAAALLRPVAVAPRNLILESNSSFAGRPLLPYSVIPGGVESAAELRNAIEHDPVVAAHYSDFDLAKARVIRLDRDEMEYVSYRLGDRVFWTKKQLKLHKGETLITDGAHEARTRCGNRLSDHGAQPTSPAQPPDAALDSPTMQSPAAPPHLYAGNYLPEPTPGPSAPLIPPPPGSPGGPTGSPIPPIYWPIPPGPPGGGPPVGPPGGGPPGGGPPVSTPEPGSLLLLAIGIGSLCAFARRKSRQA